MKILDYLGEVKQKFDSSRATEHSYRPVLENYLKYLYQNKIIITNEPKRQKCGSPDFILSKKLGNVEIPVGYIEAKDIDKNLDEIDKSDQLLRYKKSLDNLILTDYLDFIFYKNGKQYERVKIAEIENKQLIFLDENFQKLTTLLENFVLYQGQNIKSAKALASIMAKKAILMKYAFYEALIADEASGIKDQLKAFQRILIHDITEEKFANIYAQTITYGLFTARLYDETLDDFSREESYDLIPKNNPFLRQLFKYVAVDIEDEIKWAVDELCEVFRCANVFDILTDFGKTTGRNDPVVHFYEDFLKEFDPKSRKSRGVWYTPEPVVNFIIRAVDDILKTHFNLTDGIADKSKIKIKREISQSSDRRTKSGKALKEIEIHKVQLLDIATGTGTFIAEVIKQIYENYYQGQEGMWSSYVEEDLLPRLHGFEILMASYAMCHLKIDLLLKETGYKQKNTKSPQRLGVYLANSLEESDKDYHTLFASFLSNEAKEASRVKLQTPVMVAFGNPPYSVSSQNKGKWIQKLVSDYKKDLNEKNINPLSDDYIKFIRMAEYYINKTGYGIVAMITNNSFLDGVIHRQMRKHLLETFNTIYIYDLHGSAKKKETTPEGKPDKNVFDIQQGVSISIFVKHKEGKQGKKLADVYHYDSFGSREKKYEELWNNSIATTDFKKLEYKEPYYFFVPKDFATEKEYKKAFQINELFFIYNTGIETGRDNLFVGYTENETKTKIESVFSSYYDPSIQAKYKIKDNSNFRLLSGIKESSFESDKIRKFTYRPFDNRWTYYDVKIQRRPSLNVMQHMLCYNFSLITCRQQSSFDFQHSYLSKTISERCSVSLQTKELSYVFPLYLYNEDSLLEKGRSPNLNPEIVKEISAKLNLPFVEDHELSEADKKNTFSPLDLLDYIYAVLHSPSYREKYKEFLKIDFPRIPYPDNQDKFWQLVNLGSQLRQLHLLEGDKFKRVKNLITKYPIAGSNKVETINKKSFIPNKENPQLGKVNINKEQYFENVPIIAWEFYIGGYQPAQKWLKDRKSRELSHDDIFHYQKIILALSETDRLMKEIDNITDF